MFGNGCYFEKKKSHFSTTQTTHFSTYTVLVNFSPHTSCTILQPHGPKFIIWKISSERERVVLHRCLSSSTAKNMQPRLVSLFSLFIYLFFLFYCFDFIWFMRKTVFVFGCVLHFVAVEIKKRKRVRKKEKWRKDEKTIFYSTG